MVQGGYLAGLIGGLEHGFQVIGAGLDFAAQAAAGDFDGHDGRHAVGKTDDGGGDAADEGHLGAVDEIHVDGQRIHEAVGKKDAEKGADEGGGDFFADLFDGPRNGSHGDDDAQHGGHDAESGHGVRGLGQHADRFFVFVLHGLEFDFEQQLELVGLDFAVNDGTQAVAKKLHGVMVFQEAWDIW